MLQKADYGQPYIVHSTLCRAGFQFYSSEYTFAIIIAYDTDMAVLLIFG